MCIPKEENKTEWSVEDIIERLESLSEEGGYSCVKDMLLNLNLGVLNGTNLEAEIRKMLFLLGEDYIDKEVGLEAESEHEITLDEFHVELHDLLEAIGKNGYQVDDIQIVWLDKTIGAPTSEYVPHEVIYTIKS